MKKSYIQPNMELFSVAVKQTLLTVSTIEVKSQNYNEDMTDLSRGNSSWDDDEE